MNKKDKKTEEIKNKFIEIIGTLGEGIGLNRTVCQIYALLYINSHPLSPAQIGEILGISKGNVSINMRKLEEWNAVKRVWRKGYARAVFEANNDFEEVIVEKFRTGLQKRITMLKKSMEGIKNEVEIINKKKSGSGEMAELYKNKISRVNELIKKMDFLLENIDYVKSFLQT